ncbi:carboxypeptidase M32 [Fodinicurvata fenggangensis]|uniref:carboxypeptidase M32 n=1 Tax=Fodinicurvata fenggangensis TaxID=1121830 RepID=UPI0012DC1312|nr:carboxypeptidase M32 [Fodinicurvata fenggangensis]
MRKGYSVSAYQQLQQRFKRHGCLDDVLAVLNWDTAANMPAGGAEVRSEQSAELEVMQHELLTAQETGELLIQAKEECGQLDAWQAANLYEMERLWRHATAVPADLVDALSRAAQRCEMIWRDARPASDFAQTQPALQEVLDLTRKSAQAKAEALDCSLYDALLDQYEPGGSSAEVDAIFQDLAGFLPDFLPQVLERQARQPEPALPAGPFPLDRQEALGRRLMQQVGFDFGHGRLDSSLHPFCGGVPDDIRLTTRYDENDFVSSLMGILHETGHAMYERGLPADWRHQPVGMARGMALHESQSLMIEMQACRSDAFLSFLGPLLAETFPGPSEVWQTGNLARIYRKVEPGFIRVDADEVTYPAHVILRYRLEKALIEGDMQLADLPAAWNDGMKELLGITPPEDRLGCLQDIHWYAGAWGYFPTYTLGAMIAAQLFDTARKQVPDVEQRLGQGDFAPLMGWLRQNVHAWGSFMETGALLEKATGRSLDPETFKTHLRQRYLGG